MESHKEDFQRFFKQEDKKCPYSEGIESQILDNFNVCATMATITLDDSTYSKMENK